MLPDERETKNWQNVRNESKPFMEINYKLSLIFFSVFQIPSYISQTED